MTGVGCRQVGQGPAGPDATWSGHGEPVLYGAGPCLDPCHPHSNRRPLTLTLEGASGKRPVNVC